MIITVISVSEEFTKSGAPFKKVEVADGQGKQTTKNVFNNLEGKWDLLVDGATLELKMEQKGQFWNVIDILKPTLKEPQSDQEVLPEHKKIIDESNVKINIPIAPQEQGMWFKEIGELYRAGLIKKDTPEGFALIATYFARMRQVMGIETEKKPAPRKTEPFVEPDDVPF